jgi:putative ABC transport system permease protein
MTNVDLFLLPGVEPQAVMDSIHARFPGEPLELFGNRGLRREILSIFDQTFAVTRLLQGMALLIASCGITLTLLVLARERVAELALYRALGAGRLQIFRVFLGEGIGMAVLGIVLGLPGGAALAVILIYLINRAYFGWTIEMSASWGALAAQAATILAAAAVASVYPALRASRTPASELSREDG